MDRVSHQAKGELESAGEPVSSRGTLNNGGSSILELGMALQLGKEWYYPRCAQKGVSTAMKLGTGMKRRATSVAATLSSIVVALIQ